MEGIIMGICPTELVRYVIRPTLEYLGDYSMSAETLLMATAAVESEMGFHLKQKRSKGLGVFRINPRAHQLVWDRYLAKDPDLASKVRGLASQHEFLINPHLELTTNLRYATAIAWMIYRRTGKTLPEANDIRGMGRFWRRHFHSRPQASVGAFVDQYEKLIEPKPEAA